MKNSYIRNINTFLDGKAYPFAFSILYASFIGMLFYPGLLHSDSVIRWDTAISLANGGITALAGVSDHHPILPMFLMAGFYKLTGEIGLFSAVQVFFFSFLFFSFVRHFSPNLNGNIFASLALMLPINLIYSIFISYDSLFSVFFMLMFLVLLNASNLRIIILPIVLAILIGTRLNAIVILPIVILILFIQRASFAKWWHWQLTATLAIALCVIVLQVPNILKMEKGTSWLMGFAWEYANLATKTHDARESGFLKVLRCFTF